jgi:hypothetical protein
MFSDFSDADNKRYCHDLLNNTKSVRIRFQNFVFYDSNNKKIEEFSQKTVGLAARKCFFPWHDHSALPFSDGTTPTSEERSEWREGFFRDDLKPTWPQIRRLVLESQKVCQICGRPFTDWYNFNPHHNSKAVVYNDPDPDHYDLLCAEHHLFSAHRPELTLKLFGTLNFPLTKEVDFMMSGFRKVYLWTKSGIALKSFGLDMFFGRKRGATQMI